MREDLRPELAAVILGLRRRRQIRQVEQLDDLLELLRLRPGVNPREAPREWIVAPRGARADHAAHHRDAHLRALQAQALQRAQLGRRLVLGVLAHGAGVEHDQLRVARLVGLLEAQPLQTRGELRAVGGVDLATDRPDVKLRHRPILGVCAACRMVVGAWRRVWDSNPRPSFPGTRLAGGRTRPLCEPSTSERSSARWG